MHLTSTFLPLLHLFQEVFTRPSLATFTTLVTGWLLSSRHRYITECIFSSGSVGVGHWCRFHRFFSHAAWSLDEISRVLTQALVRRFVPTGLLLLGGDDTLCRKRGLTLFGAGMHHDPLCSSKALKVCSWGHDWVVLSLLVSGGPFAPTKVFALPLAFRLYKNRQGLAKGQKGKKRPVDPNHRTRPQLLVELLTLVASWFPERRFLLCADSAYGGKSVLQHLPPNVDLLSQVHPQGVLYTPPPPRAAGQRGPSRKKGERLPDRDTWANDSKQPWQTLALDVFGLHTTLWVKVQHALYYKAGKSRLLTIVLTRDAEGKRPDHRFYCTRLDWDARTILLAYARRWAVEVTFHDSKQLLGLEDAANRLPRAVARTAPLSLVSYSLVVLWFAEEGCRHVQFPMRPWYRHKREASFADMLTTLRRESWREMLGGLLFIGRGEERVAAHLLEMLCRAG